MLETGLRRLRYFAALAEELNFRRAAKKLNITQPALSRAIAQLEEEIGVKLLERSNRRVELTVAGATFAEGSTRYMRGLQATVERTRKVADGSSGSLVIGYTDTSIAGVLPDLIKSFLNNSADISVRLIQIFSARQLALLADGTIDVGVMTGPVRYGSLKAIDVQLDRFVAIVPRENTLASRAYIDLSELAAEPFVLGDPEAWGVYNSLLFSHCESAGFHPRIVQTAPESRAIVGLVACGLGVSIMPECLTRRIDTRIEAIPIRDLDASMRTQVAWSTLSRNPACQRFVEHTREVSGAGKKSPDAGQTVGFGKTKAAR